MKFYVKILFSADESNSGRAYVILYYVRVWRISLPYVSTNIPLLSFSLTRRATKKF